MEAMEAEEGLEGYREQHAAFVSHSNGTSSLEILQVGLPIHSSLLLLTATALWRGATFTSPLGAVVEVLLICLPPLLSLTILSDTPSLLSLPPAILGGAVLLLAARGRSRLAPSPPTRAPSSRVAYITNYRASMLLITTIAILAVDFPVFPRRLAKTATFGQGLMDLGTGSFVFSAGLVSGEARGRAGGWAARLLPVAPLVVLGGLRLAAVTASGYHTVVGEYGLHWNFFLSLAAVRLLGAAVPVAVYREPRRCWVAALLLAVGWEALLAGGAQAWLLGDGPRTGLIQANREGLASCLGLTALYLAGVAWGADLLALAASPASLATAAGLLVVWSALMWASLAYSSTILPPASRRLANYNFVTWTVAYNLTLLAGFALIDLAIVWVAELQEGRRATKAKSKGGKAKGRARSLLPSESPPHPALYRAPTIYRAIAANSLPFFLAANLATGAVNLSVATITTSTAPALAILALYLALLSLGALVAWHKSVTLKFW